VQGVLRLAYRFAADLRRNSLQVFNKLRIGNWNAANA
jgi:hypothetical protein